MRASSILSPTQIVPTDTERRLANDVVSALQNTGYLQLQDLEVLVDGHGVRLRGTLPSFYLRQKAHHIALRVPGVLNLVDDVDVIG